MLRLLAENNISYYKLSFYQLEDVLMAGKPTYEELEQRVKTLEIEIVERGQKNEALRVSEEKYQNLVENSYDIAYSVTPDGIMTFIGPQIDRFGYEPEDLISKNFIEFVVPEQRQEVVNSFEKGTRDGTSFPTEFQCLGKDGKRHWVEAVGKILYDDSENPLLQIGVLRDISERKRVEEALRESKAKYQDLYDSAPDMFVSVDAKTANILYCNQTLANALGYTKKEIVGRPIFDMYTPESAEHAKAKVFPIFAKTGTIEAEELQLQKKDGSKVDVSLNVSAVCDEQGDILYSRSIFRDITKRKEIEQLEADRTYLGEEIKLIHDYDNIIGESEVLKYVLYSLEQIAPTDTTVLILGESGTGKELIARAIHNGSKRKERPLIKVDCTALPANLIESELFGHEKGAFTGAVEKRIGRFELADGATLFLDEIGELPLELQQKFLRVLQDGEFERLGSSQVMHTDVRVIAATNRNLYDDVSKGRFRKDLWYRLNVFPLSMPPLRDRVDDIPLLVNWLIKKAQRRLNKNIKTVPTDIMNDLKAYSWPGNVREMENVIERAVIFTPGSMLQLAAPLKAPETDDSTLHNAPMKSLAEMEKEYILQALRKTNWNISGKYGTAELLGLNSSTLRGRMRKHGIHRPSFKP